MKYLLLAVVIGYSCVSFYKAFPMDQKPGQLTDQGIDSSETVIYFPDNSTVGASPVSNMANPNILLLTIDQIMGYIKTLGIDLPIIAQSINAHNEITQKELTQKMDPILKILENGFIQAAKKVPTSTNLNSLSDIIKAIGIVPGQDLSSADASFYCAELEKSLESITLPDHDNPFETTINLLATHPDKIYPEIVHAVYKIVVNSLTQGKPFFGILLAHSPNTNEIIVAAAPGRQTRRFDLGGGTGFAFKLPNSPVGSGNLSLAIGVAKTIDAELTELETNQNISPQCRACIKKVHKPINFLSALVVLAVLAFTIYTTFFPSSSNNPPVNATN